jgi:hypothetical protein
MIITVNKLGDGSIDNPFRPDTTATNWQLVSETETTMTIEILE